MEIQFESGEKRASRPATRMYAPTRERANDDAYTPVTRVGGDGAKADPAPERTAQPAQQMKLSSRIGIVFCSFVFAGMLVFTLSGYERITRAYADINTLNAEIDTVRLNIKALDASIECAVTITDAQDAAEKLGMRYPEQSQYAQAGGSIPLSGVAPQPAAGSPEPTEPDDTAAPGSVG